MPDDKLAETNKLIEPKNPLAKFYLGYEPEYVLKMAEEEMKSVDGKKELSSDTNSFQAMTLIEFDKGVLLATSVPDKYRTFSLEFSKNIQIEYRCVTPSEKSLAEVISLNFIRTLSIQEKISSYFRLGTMTDMGIRYLAILSKELDRAERHYLTALQALRSLRMPPLEVNIKTNTAVVGQNQIVQANSKND